MVEVKKVGRNTWKVMGEVGKGQVELTFVRKGSKVYLLLNSGPVEVLSLTPYAKGREEEVIERALRGISFHSTTDVRSYYQPSTDTVRVEERRDFYVSVPSLTEGSGEGEKALILSRISALPLSFSDLPTLTEKKPSKPKNPPRQRTAATRRGPSRSSKQERVGEEAYAKGMREKGVVEVHLLSRKGNLFQRLLGTRPTYAYVTYTSGDNSVTYRIGTKGSVASLEGVKYLGNGAVRIDLTYKPFIGSEESLQVYLYPSGEVAYYRNGQRVSRPGFLEVERVDEIPEEAVIVSRDVVDGDLLLANRELQRQRRTA